MNVILIFTCIVLILLLMYVNSLRNDCKEWKNENNRLRQECRSITSQSEEQTKALHNQIEQLKEIKSQLQKRNDFLQPFISNQTAIPYMAKIIADYETREIEKMAISLDWGHNIERQKKVQSLREIRAKTKQLLQQYKESDYQLHYILQLYPQLEKVLQCEYSEMPSLTFDQDDNDEDPVSLFLSKEEYDRLSAMDRNQLALDRYVSSHNKSKWQIGRDYELSIGYQYEKKGMKVQYYGEYMGLQDLGRDLIITSGDTTTIVQCKYWSAIKEIHEKHVMQLFGSIVSYCVEHNIPRNKVKGVLVTNIQLSETAKKIADYLKIHYRENVPMSDFPRIKCNIGRDEYGCETRIYHLPFDQQYDSTKVDKPGELMAFTVMEAESHGFRRAGRWKGR